MAPKLLSHDISYRSLDAGRADQCAGHRHGAAAGGERAGVPGAGTAGAGAGRGAVPGDGAGVQRGPGAAAEHRTAAHPGDALTEALEAFGAAWLEAYGMDEADATITDVVGTFGVSV